MRLALGSGPRNGKSTGFLTAMPVGIEPFIIGGSP
jgi:hypothetical protein